MIVFVICEASALLLYNVVDNAISRLPSSLLSHSISGQQHQIIFNEDDDEGRGARAGTKYTTTLKCFSMKYCQSNCTHEPKFPVCHRLIIHDFRYISVTMQINI